MNGQLWQECEARRCAAQPVCIDCMHCQAHCQCRAEPGAPDAGGAAPVRSDPPAQPDPPLSEASVLCEGRRLNAVTLGPTLTARAGQPGVQYRSGTTPSGRPVTVAFSDYGVRAHGQQDALDELLLAGFTLSPAAAFDLLTDAHNATHGFRHALNEDAPRLADLAGRDALITAVRSAPHVRRVSGRGPSGVLYPHGEREVEQAHGLSVQWVTFSGYPAALTADERQRGLQELYRAEETGTWYLGTHGGAQLLTLNAEQLARLVP